MSGETSEEAYLKDKDDVDLEASSLLVPSDGGTLSRRRRAHDELESENERLWKMVKELQEEVAYLKHSTTTHKPEYKSKQSFCTLDTASETVIDDDDRSSLTSSSSEGFFGYRCSWWQQRLRLRRLFCKKRVVVQEEDDLLPVKEMEDEEEEVVVVQQQRHAAGNIDDMSWQQQLYDRGGWLVGLLVLQSMSSFIIKRNEELLQHHDVLVQFLTMLVGAGGNAGNQASVRVIRGLATGKIVSSNMKPFLRRELQTGVVLSLLLGLSGYIRATIFQVPLLETMAITSSLWMIVMISIIIGTILPLTMKVLHIDPAHSSTSIQVIMDILGVALTVHVSSWILDSSVFSSWEL